MNATEITALVAKSASRFGHRNPQQFKQLLSRLGKAEPQVVAHGLLEIFTEGQPPPEGAAAQELAGRLLVELLPRSEIELEPAIRASLARYELSVEQFPRYLAAIHGAERVLFVLQGLESEPLTEQELRSLRALQFWLAAGDGGVAEVATGNGAVEEERKLALIRNLVRARRGAELRLMTLGVSKYCRPENDRRVFFPPTADASELHPAALAFFHLEFTAQYGSDVLEVEVEGKRWFAYPREYEMWLKQGAPGLFLDELCAYIAECPIEPRP